MTAPTNLFITPAYLNPAQSERDKAQLWQDCAWAYDQAFLGPSHWVQDPQNILSDWADHNKSLVNTEACLVMTYKGQLFLEAYLLLINRWGFQRMKNFEDWVASVFRGGAAMIYSRYSNWGAWGLLGCTLADTILGKSLVPHSNRFNELISKATDDHGALWIEAERTNSGMWYSYFCLAPMLRVAQLLPVDKWMLYDPLCWLWQYVLDPQSWPYKPKKGFWGFIQNIFKPHASKLELPKKNDWPGDLYHVAGIEFERNDWRDWGTGPPYWTDIFRHGE